MAVVLRQDGTVEFYSNFVFLDKYEDKEKECVDVENAGDRFVFRCVNEKNKKLIKASLMQD